MAKEEGILVEGVVISAEGGDKFKVQLENGHEVLAHLSGKIRKNFIRILPADRVQLEISPYNLAAGRITYRYK